MKELQPERKSDIVPFSVATQECLDKIDSSEESVEFATAHIYNNGKYCYIAKGSSLELLNLSSGNRLSACDFSSLNSMRNITCVCMCNSQLVIGLKCDAMSSKGLLCVYDLGVSRVVKAVMIPSIPQCLEMIKYGGGAAEPTSFLSPALKCCFGVVAVGTETGHLYLTDLRTDDLCEQFSITSPSTLLVIDPSEMDNNCALRDKAREQDKHCSIDLSGSMCSGKGFKYISPCGKILKSCFTDNCGISALMFMPQSVELVVGYTFGCFQVWSMENFQLLYSSDIGLSGSPITHFLSQEPDDDPRHCCYLWLGRGPLPTQQQINTPTSLEMFQMSYKSKEIKKNFGAIYKNLECITSRFKHQLTSDAHHLVDSRSVGSRIISLKSFDGDSSVCYVLWEAPSNDTEDMLTCHLGVFDINRWYQKQLPSSIRQAMYGRMEAVCPFFVFYTMSDIAENFLPNGLLDVYVNTSTRTSFRTCVGPQSEQFYWPSSSSFEVVCVSETGSLKAKMLGTQKQLLADIRKMGTDSFLEAQNIMQMCWVNGLLDHSIHEITKDNNDKRTTDALLSLSLEHGSLTFVMACIKKWACGSITHNGHSLKLIYDWAWNQVVNRKKQLNDMHDIIFCSTTETFEVESLRMVKKVVLEMQTLKEVFHELNRVKVLTSDEGVEELKLRESITKHLSMYGNLLLLLLDCGLVPEKNSLCIGQENSARTIVYPREALSEFYEESRKALLDLNNKALCLFIDLIWKQINPETSSSAVQFDDQYYPPSTVEAMCSLFLRSLFEGENLPMMLLYYWTLDVCECLEDLQSYKLVDKIRECLRLSSTESALIESFWLLDHQLFGDAMECLAQVTVEIPPVYYVHVVRTLYSLHQTDLLVTFCSCKEPASNLTKENTQFLINVFLELKMLPNAYELQNKSHVPGIFKFFLEKCKSCQMLGKLITLALTSDEELQLRSFLQSSTNHQDFLLIYYLEHGMFAEAFTLSKQFQKSTNVSFNRFAQDQMSTRCLLVNGFMKMIPYSQRRRITNKATSSKLCSDFKKSPLSTVLQKHRHKDTSYELSLLHETYNESLNINDLSYFEDLMPGERRRKSTLFDGEVVSPRKKQKEMPKPKLADSTIPFANSTNKARKQSYCGSDALLLLKAPPVNRNSPYLQTTVQVESSKTPQSILKSRRTLRKAEPSLDDASCRTLFVPPGSTPSRKIRFVGFNSPINLTPEQSPVPSAAIAVSAMEESPNHTYIDVLESDQESECEMIDEDLELTSFINESVNEGVPESSPSSKEILKLLSSPELDPNIAVENTYQTSKEDVQENTSCVVVLSSSEDDEVLKDIEEYELTDEDDMHCEIISCEDDSKVTGDVTHEVKEEIMIVDDISLDEDDVQSDNSNQESSFCSEREIKGSASSSNVGSPVGMVMECDRLTNKVESSEDVDEFEEETGFKNDENSSVCGVIHDVASTLLTLDPSEPKNEEADYVCESITDSQIFKDALMPQLPDDDVRREDETLKNDNDVRNTDNDFSCPREKGLLVTWSDGLNEQELDVINANDCIHEELNSELFKSDFVVDDERTDCIETEEDQIYIPPVTTLRRSTRVSIHGGKLSLEDVKKDRSVIEKKKEGEQIAVIKKKSLGRRLKNEQVELMSPLQTVFIDETKLICKTNSKDDRLEDVRAKKNIPKKLAYHHSITTSQNLPPSPKVESVKKRSGSRKQPKEESSETSEVLDDGSGIQLRSRKSLYPVSDVSEPVRTRRSLPRAVKPFLEPLSPARNTRSKTKKESGLKMLIETGASDNGGHERKGVKQSAPTKDSVLSFESHENVKKTKTSKRSKRVSEIIPRRSLRSIVPKT